MMSLSGEDIDLPVVQYDNEYYLSHDFFGHRDYDGTLFVNAANRLLPRDDVVLIHGHNMKSGAQFGRLRRFEEYRYAVQHPIVVFRTIWDEEEAAYVVAAAFNASMTEENPEYFDIGRLRFHPIGEEEIGDGSEDFTQYLARLKNKSIWDAPIDLCPTDELLMLVTCSYYQENGRFVLVCRRLREVETREMIENAFAEDQGTP